MDSVASEGEEEDTKVNHPLMTWEVISLVHRPQTWEGSEEGEIGARRPRRTNLRRTRGEDGERRRMAVEEEEVVVEEEVMPPVAVRVADGDIIVWNPRWQLINSRIPMLMLRNVHNCLLKLIDDAKRTIHWTFVIVFLERGPGETV